MTLQTHKGSPGTQSTAASRLREQALQTHKGSPGTLLISSPDFENRNASNPQRFAWNLCKLTEPTPATSASNPQRFAWNAVVLMRDVRSVDASNPQRFAWNVLPAPYVIAPDSLQTHKGSPGTCPGVRAGPRLPRFKPTKVRLEPLARPLTVVPSCASNPQRFAWNPPHFRGCSACRGWSHKGISIDPQFSLNPRGLMDVSKSEMTTVR